MKKPNNSPAIDIPKILYEEKLLNEQNPHIGSNIRTGWMCTKKPSFDAYLYAYYVTIDTVTKEYIGWHGTENKRVSATFGFGGYTTAYKHSSKNPDFIRDLRNPNASITHLILECGTMDQMRQAEYELLSSANAVSNSNYYNRSNGGGRGVVSSADPCYDIIMNIVNKRHANKYQKTSVDIATLRGYEVVQARLEAIDWEHIQNLLPHMLKDPNQFEVLVLMPNPKNKNGRPLIADGNHAVQTGVKASKDRSIAIPIVEVPYDDWKLLEGNLVALRQLGLLCNTQSFVPRKPNSHDDIANSVAELITERNLYMPTVTPEDGLTPNWKHPEIDKYLGESALAVSERNRKKIIAKAEKIYLNNRIVSLGKTVCNWQNAPDKAGVGGEPNSSEYAYYQKYKASVHEQYGSDTLIFIRSRDGGLWPGILRALIEPNNIGNLEIKAGQKIVVCLYDSLAMHSSSVKQKAADMNERTFHYLYNAFYISKINLVSTVHLPRYSDELSEIKE